MEKYFAVGDEVVAFGKLVSLKPRTVDHPETEVVETGEENFIHLNRITPIYPLTEGLPQRWVRSLIWRTLNQFEARVPEPWLELTRRGSKVEGRAAPLPCRPTCGAARGCQWGHMAARPLARSVMRHSFLSLRRIT